VRTRQGDLQKWLDFARCNGFPCAMSDSVEIGLSPETVKMLDFACMTRIALQSTYHFPISRFHHVLDRS